MKRPMPFSGLQYRQVDVFSQGPLSGNGLAVFPGADGLSREIMQGLTRELRQFESIFLSSTGREKTYRAFIFTMEEELDFAGHPILGAAAVVHEKYGSQEQEEWTFVLNNREVRVLSSRHQGIFEAVMDQGPPSFGEPLGCDRSRPFLKALNLSEGDQAEGFPLQVVSTGLPYLIIPVGKGLDRARIARPGLEEMLSVVGAKFAYVLDIGVPEGRTWDNDGKVEDIATGSAAGPAGAYLCRHGAAETGTTLVLHQGRFMGRPSEIRVRVEAHDGGPEKVYVSGQVTMVATGVFD